MADSYDPIDDALAAAFDDDAEAPGGSETADSPSAAAAPDEPDRDAADETPAEDEDATPDAEALAAEVAEDDAGAIAEPETPAAATAPPVDWDAPENPYRAKVQELEPTAQKAAQYEALFRTAAERRAQELAAQRLRSLSDDDPQRATELQAFVQEQQRPLMQQVQSLEGEVETVAKAATVLDAAVRLFAPPELQAKIDAEVERLMRLPGGYSVLQNHIATRQEIASAATQEADALRKENERLRKQLAAKAQIAQRQASGADVVDSGPGSGGAFADRWAAAKSFDDAFDAIVSDIPELAPAR